MTQDALDFTASHARSRDPETSHDAAAGHAETHSAACTRLLAWVMTRGVYGATYKESDAAFPGESMQQRLSDLKADGLVVPSGERRDGCAVMVAEVQE